MCVLAPATSNLLTLALSWSSRVALCNRLELTMITHHLDFATLLSCSAGSQPESLAAVTAVHLAVCPTCASELAKAHVIGEAMFAMLPPVALTHAIPSPTSGVNHGQRTAARAPNAPSATLQNGDVPLPLVSVLGHHLSDVQWDKVADGVWTAPVALSSNSRGGLHLLKLAPGVVQPAANTACAKLGVVLAGSYQDGGQAYLSGDIADFETQLHHHIAADATTGCICLIGVDG